MLIRAAAARNVPRREQPMRTSHDGDSSSSPPFHWQWSRQPRPAAPSAVSATAAEMLALDHEGAVRRCQRGGRPLHAEELQRHGGEDPHLRRHPARDLSPRQEKQGRERHWGSTTSRTTSPRARTSAASRAGTRTGSRWAVHARRRHVPAAHQQPAELAARRHGRLRQARLGGDAVHDLEDRRARPRVHEPRRRPGLPG